MDDIASAEWLEPLVALIPDTAQLHSIAVHFPIALAVCGVLFTFIASFIPADGPALRRFLIGYYALLCAAAFAAVQSGERAAGQLSGNISKEIWDRVERHEHFAEYLIYFGAATAVLVALSFFGESVFKRWMMMLAFAASIATACWVGYVGHLGGSLVYEHGLGVENPIGWKLETPANQPPGLRTFPTRPSQPVHNSNPDGGETIEEDLDPIFPSANSAALSGTITWAAHIYPILEDSCFECHRPGKMKSELDLTTREAMLRGGKKYGSAIVPGNPGASKLFRYVRGEYKPQMPKDDWPLDDEQIEVLRRWIANGALGG